MEKKLYVVTLEVETLVYAASPAEAREAGRQSMSDDILFPDYWPEDEYPHGSEDRTVGEILAVGEEQA